MNANSPKKIGLSYAWPEDGGAATAPLIAELQTLLTKAQVELVSGTTRAEQTEKLGRLASESDGIVSVLLSDAFLRSVECLWELLQLRAAAEVSKCALVVWTLPNLGPVNWADVAADWQRRGREAEQEAKKIAPGVVPSLQRSAEIGRQAEAIRAFLEAGTIPFDLPEFSTRMLGADATGSATHEEMLGRAYDNVLSEMEQLLKGNPRLRSFVQARVPGVIAPDRTTAALTPEVRDRKFDLAGQLKAVKLSLPQFDGSTADLSDLEAFLGGLIVLGIDPRWVTTQRAFLLASSIEYPGLFDYLPFGQGQRANFLHILAAALANGTARLSRVFGDPADDRRWLGSLAGSRFTVKKSDRKREIQLHLVRFVLGPTLTVNESDEAEIKYLFGRVQRILKFAREEEHDPFVASGAGGDYQQLVSLLREQLGVADLILLHPRGQGDEDELLYDSVAVLSHLSHIWKTLNDLRKRSAA